MKHAFSLILLLFITTGFYSANYDFGQRLAKAFQEYNLKFSPSAIQVDLNQPSYFPGDTVYFSTRYTLQNRKALVAGRDVVNLLILDAMDSTIAMEKFVIQNGLGSHQFRIKPDISPGVYRLLAFTNWMQNLGGQSYFETELIIEGSEQFERIEQSPEYFISTSSLIQGIQNQIIVNSNLGKPGVSVEILDQKNTPITSALTDTLGLAALSLTPTAGNNYSIVVASKYNTPIIHPAKEGISLFTTRQADRTDVYVQRSEAYISPVPIYFVLYNHERIIQLKELTFVDNKTEIKFSVAHIQGLMSAEIIDVNGVKKAAVQILGASNLPQVTVTLENSECTNRESVTAKINLTNSNTGAESAVYNVRIVNTTLFSMALDITRVTLAKLQSLNLSESQIQRWLATQRNKQLIDWEALLTNNITLTHNRESYIYISGTAKNKISGELVPDSTRIMLFFQKKAFGYEAYCKNGVFSVPILFDVEEVDHIFVSAKYKYESLSDLEVSFNPGIIPVVSAKNPTLFRISKEENPNFKYHSLKLKVDNSFGYYNSSKSKPSRVDEIGSILEDELGQPDYTLSMGDYLILPSMAEVTKELLKSVEYKKTKTSERIRVYVTNYNPRKSGDPLFIIDGHLTKNPKHFLQLDPSNLLTIKLFRESNKLMRFGTLSSDGIIVIKTSKPSKLPLDNEIRFDGLLMKVKSVPFNQSFSTNLPDLRPCLYWNPNVSVDFSGESRLTFNTSDDVGTYVIQVTGYTDKGVPFYSEKKLTVKHMAKPN